MVTEEKESPPRASLSEQAGHLIDNLIKSFLDSLVSEDKFVASISATKRWVDFPAGWIECTVDEVEMQTYPTPPAKE